MVLLSLLCHFIPFAGALQAAAIRPPPFRVYDIKLKTPISKEDLDEHLERVDFFYTASLKAFASPGPRPRGIVHRQSMGSFVGYSGEFISLTASSIQSLPEVENIRESSPADLLLALNLPAYAALGTPDGRSANWALGRISHRQPRVAQYSRNAAITGERMFAYVVDTGISASHTELVGRVRGEMGWSFEGGAPAVDEHGHGTMCASIIGGKTVGVLQGVNLVPVKVGKDTPMSYDLVAGLDWIYNDIERRGIAHNAIVNVCMATDSPHVVAATDALHAMGVLTVVGAGNVGSSDLKRLALSDKTLTVGAIRNDDALWKLSNFGPGVDIFAPGAKVASASIGSDTALEDKSGTSLAAPLVAGMALYLMELEGYMEPEKLKRRILELGTDNSIKDLPPDTVNKIVFNNGA